MSCYLSHEKHVSLNFHMKNISGCLSYEKTCHVTCHMKSISGFMTPVICELFLGKKTHKKDALIAFYNSALDLL